MLEVGYKNRSRDTRWKNKRRCILEGDEDRFWLSTEEGMFSVTRSLRREEENEQ